MSILFCAGGRHVSYPQWHQVCALFGYVKVVPLVINVAFRAACRLYHCKLLCPTICPSACVSMHVQILCFKPNQILNQSISFYIFSPQKSISSLMVPISYTLPFACSQSPSFLLLYLFSISFAFLFACFLSHFFIILLFLSFLPFFSLCLS